jgi:hypothetical protein
VPSLFSTVATGLVQAGRQEVRWLEGRIEAVAISVLSHGLYCGDCSIRMATEKSARSRKSLWPLEMRLAPRDSVPILHCMRAAFLKQNVAA